MFVTNYYQSNQIALCCNFELEPFFVSLQSGQSSSYRGSNVP